MKDRHLLFKYIFGLTVYILFFPLAVSATDSFIHFKRLSVDDGLSQNTVLALTQDHNNKIWVGTIDGLNWYEGSRFVSYYKAPDDTTSLANNHVISLHTDSKGTVWVGTQVGLSRYNIVGNSKYGSSIFSKITAAVEEGKKEFPFTLGQNQYDFIDYQDFCIQVAEAICQNKEQGIINICSGRPEKLADRVERFINENNYDIKLQYGVFPDRPYDSKAIWGDNTKISKILNN